MYIKFHVYYNYFTDKQALYIAMNIADAVHYMHSQDPIVIHQDLKPQNVLVS